MHAVTNKLRVMRCTYTQPDVCVVSIPVRCLRQDEGVLRRHAAYDDCGAGGVNAGPSIHTTRFRSNLRLDRGKYVLFNLGCGSIN